MNCQPRVLAMVLGLAMASSATAADWPQFHGPDRSGVSKETGLLRQWPDEGPPLAWTATGLGGGFSAPAVVGGRIYGMGNLGDDEIVWALNEADGKPLWNARLGPALQQGASQAKEGPAGTPAVDGDYLYVQGLGGDISCVRLADGHVVWQRSLTKDFQARAPQWSFRESLLVDGGNVICTPGGPKATIVAFDKATGKTVWKAAVPGDPSAAYASPIVFDFAGQRQYVQLTAKALVAVSPEGKFLWKYDKPAGQGGINCASAVYQDGMVFASSAYNTGGGAARLTKKPDGDITATEVYFNKVMQNHHGGMVLYDGCIYGASGGNEGGFLICLDFKTGKLLWSSKSSQRPVPKGSLAVADQRIYYRTENGEVILIEPSATEYIERGRFQEPQRSGAPEWTHPVIANGRLYLRDQENLTCYNIQAE